MGKRAHGGWTLQRDRRTGVWYVRFRHDGKRRNLTTGETDRRTAQAQAAAIYARAISGRRQGARLKAPPLEDLMGEWLAAFSADHAPETAAEYERYCLTHFGPVFGSLANITRESAADFGRKRLRQVSASTVRKELSALRSFVEWCHESGFLPEPVAVRGVPKRAVGTPSTKAPQVKVLLSPVQLERMLAKIPELTRRPRGRPEAPPIPARAAVLVLVETGIRRATLRRLRAPEHYHRRSKVLRITEDVDKARAGRPLPLTARCREALDSVCPREGLIFGPIDLRHQLTEASKGIGLPRHLAGRVSYHDLRHSYLTHLAESGASLAAIQYLGGHKHASTSARYIHPGQKAAEEGIEALQKRRIGTPVGTPRRKPKKAGGGQK